MTYKCNWKINNTRNFNVYLTPDTRPHFKSRLYQIQIQFLYHVASNTCITILLLHPRHWWQQLVIHQGKLGMCIQVCDVQHNLLTGQGTPQTMTPAHQLHSSPATSDVSIVEMRCSVIHWTSNRLITAPNGYLHCNHTITKQCDDQEFLQIWSTCKFIWKLFVNQLMFSQFWNMYKRHASV